MVAPPYDVIGPDEQRRYYRQHPCNVVRLIAGEVRASDHPGDNKYTRARAFFQQWLGSGVLRREPSPCLYVYRQTFRLPGSEEARSRSGIVCVVELEPFGRGVLAHERTHVWPKADRLSLTQAVTANLSPVFALHQGHAGSLAPLLADAMAHEPRLQIRLDGGEEHAVWCVRSPEHFRILAHALEPSPLFIADGHHRYETALNYRDQQRAAHPEAPPEAAFNYVLMLLVDAADPNLVILPTHRLLRELDGFDGRALLRRLKHRHRVGEWTSRQQVVAALGEPVAHRVGVALHGGLWATIDLVVPSAAHPVSRLDVTALHREVFERELGLHEGILENERHLAYSRDIDHVLRQVAQGSAQAAFLLRPPAVSDVLQVAAAGEVMPQKSTYFYPKPLSGIVFNPLDPVIRIADV